MKIDRPEVQFDLTEATEEDLPEWYGKRLVEALSQMETREKEESKAQQDASSNH
jgi:hypothetical protein